MYEKRSSLGWKLLVAGGSGLNLSHKLPLEDFAAIYKSPSSPSFFREWLQVYPPEHWLEFVERRLGMETFLGTSGRYFVREMKSSRMLQTWVRLLNDRGVLFFRDSEFIGFETTLSRPTLQWRDSSGERRKEFDAIVLALGGGSWEKEIPKWPDLFQRKRIGIVPFTPSNVGWEVDWPLKFLKEAVRKPLKNIVLKTSLGEKAGDLLVTEYGLEGTPIYFVGVKGIARLDLKPSLTEEQIKKKLSGKSKRSPIRCVDRFLKLGEAAFAWVFHMAPEEVRRDGKKLSRWIKHSPIEFQRPRPLSEAISSKGGVRMDQLSEDPRFPMMLKKHPGIFLCGEMLDWDAPTGGFLIQACVLQGILASRGVEGFLKSSPGMS